MKSVLALPDIHYPENISLKPILSLCEDVGGFDIVVLLGDALDMTPISHWLKDRRRKLEGKRLLKDYEGFMRDILNPLAEANPGAQFVWTIGNHEDWVERYIDYNPEMEGLIEPQHHITLPDDRKIKWIPLNDVFRIGHLSYTHGAFSNKYHAYKHVITYGNLIYGHTHTVQAYTEVSPFGRSDTHKAQSIGCLCNKSPAYLRGRKNQWVHAFNVAYVHKNGLFNDYTIHINNGRFVFNGETYP